ncbi:MAG TPA: energy transducer TonB [Rhodothermia bacterium]|nr:energy transducer TonB [Rhodothermia bacterium]
MAGFEAGVTANDRFKSGFNNWFWGSIAAAALIHGLMFAFWPSMASSDVSFSTSELEAIELPPEVKIPPPPQAISRPAMPVVGEAKIDENITIAATTFEENPVNNLPPPPTSSAASEDISKAPTFTPFTVAPRLLNADEVGRSLERNYPPLLRDAGIGGNVNVWFFIDEDGKVLKKQLAQSSGYPALDDAGLNVADLMRFSPAQNRDKKVQVWVSLPIKFSTK